MAGSSFVFNIAKGRASQLALDDATVFGVLLLQTVEADSLMRDRDTIAAVVANSTEADATDYARKTGITVTRTVDDTNDRVVLSLPTQTWVLLGGATNNTIRKAIIFYEVSGSDAGRVPLVAIAVADKVTNNTDFVMQQSDTYFWAST